MENIDRAALYGIQFTINPDCIGFRRRRKAALSIASEMLSVSAEPTIDPE